MQRNCLRRVIGTLCFLLLILAAHAQKYTVTGGKGTPYLAFDNKKGNTSSRFEVYLVYGMDNVEIRYTPTSSTYQWYRYKNKAGVGGDAEKIPSVNEGNTTVIRNIEEGYGYYILEDDAYSKAGGYVWIIDYSKYEFNITSLFVEGDNQSIIPKTATATITGNPFKASLEPPYSDTEVELKGDQFARHFGVEKSMLTDMYQAVAVLAVMKIDTLSYASDVPNMVVKGDSLSAPVEFNFTAIANTPVAAMFNWKIYRKDEGGGSSEGNEEGEENNGTLLRDFSGEETSFIFNQNGTYVVKLTVNDRTGQCQANPPDVTVNISDSYLDVPNAFSPGTSPGINDEFRVAYRSLTRFKCWIFNRWGVEMYHWTDPSKGWDGKKGGKYVAPGVYFYVIEATGSDGKPIKRKGSINILRSKQIQDEIIEE